MKTLQSWKKRYFVLDVTKKEIEYFEGHAKINGDEIATFKVPDGVRSVTFTTVGKGIYGAGLIATKSGYGYFPLAAGSVLTKSSVPVSNIRVLSP
jgi:hypothetical protein